MLMKLLKALTGWPPKEPSLQERLERELLETRRAILTEESAFENYTVQADQTRCRIEMLGVREDRLEEHRKSMAEVREVLPAEGYHG